MIVTSGLFIVEEKDSDKFGTSETLFKLWLNDGVELVEFVVDPWDWKFNRRDPKVTIVLPIVINRAVVLLLIDGRRWKLMFCERMWSTVFVYNFCRHEWRGQYNLLLSRQRNDEKRLRERNRMGNLSQCCSFSRSSSKLLKISLLEQLIENQWANDSKRKTRLLFSSPINLFLEFDLFDCFFLSMSRKFDKYREKERQKILFGYFLIKKEREAKGRTKEKRWRYEKQMWKTETKEKRIVTNSKEKTRGTDFAVQKCHTNSHLCEIWRRREKKSRERNKTEKNTINFIWLFVLHEDKQSFVQQ